MSSADEDEFHDAAAIVGSLQSQDYLFYSDNAEDSDDSGQDVVVECDGTPRYPPPQGLSRHDGSSFRGADVGERHYRTTDKGICESVDKGHTDVRSDSGEGRSSCTNLHSDGVNTKTVVTRKDDLADGEDDVDDNDDDNDYQPRKRSVDENDDVDAFLDGDAKDKNVMEGEVPEQAPTYMPENKIQASPPPPSSSFSAAAAFPETQQHQATGFNDSDDDLESAMQFESYAAEVAKRCSELMEGEDMSFDIRVIDDLSQQKGNLSLQSDASPGKFQSSTYTDFISSSLDTRKSFNDLDRDCKTSGVDKSNGKEATNTALFRPIVPGEASEDSESDESESAINSGEDDSSGARFSDGTFRNPNDPSLDRYSRYGYETDPSDCQLNSTFSSESKIMRTSGKDNASLPHDTSSDILEDEDLEITRITENRRVSKSNNIEESGQSDDNTPEAVIVQNVTPQEAQEEGKEPIDITPAINAQSSQADQNSIPRYISITTCDESNDLKVSDSSITESADKETDSPDISKHTDVKKDGQTVLDKKEDEAIVEKRTLEPNDGDNNFHTDREGGKAVKSVMGLKMEVSHDNTNKKEGNIVYSHKNVKDKDQGTGILLKDAMLCEVSTKPNMSESLQENEAVRSSSNNNDEGQNSMPQESIAQKLMSETLSSYKSTRERRRLSESTSNTLRKTYKEAKEYRKDMATNYDSQPEMQGPSTVLDNDVHSSGSYDKKQCSYVPRTVTGPGAAEITAVNINNKQIFQENKMTPQSSITHTTTVTTGINDDVGNKTSQGSNFSYSPSMTSAINDGNGQKYNGNRITSGSSFQDYQRSSSTEDEESETTPLIKKSTPTVYHRRWYVLFVFSLAALLQGLGWGTWGPITQSAKSVFGWSDRNIALMTLSNNASYLVCCFPFSWLLERKGLKISMIISTILLAAGIGIRCVSSDSSTATWTIFTGQILLGTGSVVPYSAVSMVSSVWFPMHQRATATSISTFVGYAGVALAFVLGPAVVPEPAHSHNLSTNLQDNVTNLPEQRDAIMNYMYYQAGLAGITLLLVIVYFPDKPPTPPSITAHIERLEFKKGLKSLFKNKQFLILFVAFGIGTGVYGGFSIVIDIDLKPLGISQTTAGWMGFYTTIGGCVLGILMSRISDIFMRRLKFLLLLMSIPATGILAWFCLLTAEYIPFDLVSLYICVIVPGCLNYGAIGLFYELACEASYPTGEGITTLILSFINNVFGIIFLGIMLVPNLGVGWMNWMLLGSAALTSVLLLLSKVSYHRTNIDSMEIIVEPPENQPQA